jgi:hypothetical protein
MEGTTNWQNLIGEALAKNSEGWADVVGSTLSPYDMQVLFDNGYGNAEGKPFTMWTNNRVYFPVCYDGAEWVGSAPRNPCDVVTGHQGGW